MIREVWGLNPLGKMRQGRTSWGRSSKTRGFTLVEMLVVMAIIGILATIGGSSFLTSRLRGRDAERKSALAQVQRALELYYNDHNRYPDAVPWGAVFDDPDNSDTVYMSLTPDDPRDPNQVYLYEVSTTGQEYRLYARLENTEDGVTDLNNDGTPGDEYDGTAGIGDGLSKDCGDLACNYGVASSSTNMGEVLQ